MPKELAQGLSHLPPGPRAVHGGVLSQGCPRFLPGLPYCEEPRRHRPCWAAWWLDHLVVIVGFSKTRQGTSRNQIYYVERPVGTWPARGHTARLWAERVGPWAWGSASMGHGGEGLGLLGFTLYWQVESIGAGVRVREGRGGGHSSCHLPGYPALATITKLFACGLLCLRNLPGSAHLQGAWLRAQVSVKPALSPGDLTGSGNRQGACASSGGQTVETFQRHLGCFAVRLQRGHLWFTAVCQLCICHDTAHLQGNASVENSIQLHLLARRPFYLAGTEGARQRGWVMRLPCGRCPGTELVPLTWFPPRASRKCRLGSYLPAPP